MGYSSSTHIDVSSSLPQLRVVSITSSYVPVNEARMRLKVRHVIMALVILWLLVSVVYVFPFLFAVKEPPPVVSIFQTRPYGGYVDISLRMKRCICGMYS